MFVKRDEDCDTIILDTTVLQSHVFNDEEEREVKRQIKRWITDQYMRAKRTRTKIAYQLLAAFFESVCVSLTPEGVEIGSSVLDSEFVGGVAFVIPWRNVHVDGVPLEPIVKFVNAEMAEYENANELPRLKIVEAQQAA